MRNRILNISLIVAVVAILAVLAVYVRVGATADAVVVLRTTGMTCSSCISTVTKALQSQKGVAATEVDLAGGWVIAGYDSKAVAPQLLANKVAQAGFASEVEVVLTPEQFKKIAGHQIGAKGTSTGCGKGCCGK